jgi:hypothetical protein
MRASHDEGANLIETATASPKVVEIFYFDAGGGHRNAMTALSRLIADRHPDWTVIPVDLQKLLEPIDPVHRLTRAVTGSLSKLLTPVAPRISMEPWQAQDIYNNALKRGATRGMGTILPVLQAFIRRQSNDIERLLAARWSNAGTPRPDLVVSVIPNFNRVMFAALRKVHSHVPYLTVMTDMVDCPPHFWMEDQDQIMVCGTKKAFEQAMSIGYYARQRIHLVSGMILKGSFYEEPQDSGLSRQSLGLDPDPPTALIMFGGNGSSKATEAILDQFSQSRRKIQAIVLCGKNGKLLEALADRPRCHAVGFVSNVADYMRLADFFIGKPGPGSISEAVHMGLPVIVEKNTHTMPQEKPNPDWVDDNGLGIVVTSFRRGITEATERLLDNLDTYKANIRDNIPENRAVFEIVDILAATLADAKNAAAALPS